MADWNDDFVATTPFDLETFKLLVPSQSEILDIGCGYGRICDILENNGYSNIIGIDTSINQINKAKGILRFTHLINANFLEFDFKNKKFDSIISFGVIDCCYKTQEFKEFIKKCTNMLRPNGYWFINYYTMNLTKEFEEKYRQGYKKYGIKRVFDSKSGFTFKHYSLLEILNEVNQDFDVLSYKLVPFYSYHQAYTVNGACLILKKIDFRSEFR